MRRQGSGNFVRGRVEKNFAMLTSFSEDMRARGRTPRSDWLKRGEGTVTPEEALTLRSSPGTPVYRFHRLRFADDAPMSVEYATIVAACLPSLDAVGVSLYEALERAGNRPVRALQRLRALLLTREQARCCARSPATRVCWSSGSASCSDGRAIEFSQSYYRGDTYDFVAELGTLAVNARYAALFRGGRDRMPRRRSRAQLRANRDAIGELGKRAAALRPARRRHLRARQFRPRRDLRKIPDRDAHRAARRHPRRRR